MPKLSVVIITYNEEKNIGRCIDSVKDIADDIVVVDSYSTDKTKEISIAKGARFVEHTFEGHIQQKNWAITQAKYPHILSLDADELPDERLKKEILKTKENWTADGYYFNRLNNYCGKWLKHSGWYPDRKLRLWDSRKGKWAGQNPHDRFTMTEDATTHYLKGDLLHYSFYSVSQHVLQVNKFTDIGSQAAFNKGKKSSLLQIFFYPKWKFIRDYFIKLGILDGYYGYVVCKISAHAKYLKYVKLRELRKAAR
ncbi:MAG: glycosyltransferase family 2 protein [Bacteroidales bacterium]|nr:glycosyltransferase family 2 protein [Bacteroidales bacterium]MBN2819222.1 glycosyltransferase family 2 protein [Bacteroidales bacterium]